MDAHRRRPTLRFLPLTVLWLLAAAAGARASVDLILSPSVTRVDITPGEFDVDVIAQSNSGASQAVNAALFILIWDPAKLELVCSQPLVCSTFNTSPDYEWLLEGFFPSDPGNANDPYHLNDDLDDGDALYTVQSNFPLASVPVSPGMRVTRFHFRARALSDGTLIQFQASRGPAVTIVQALGGGDVTGSLAGTATVRICPLSGSDPDGDGLFNECDPDDDNDGVPDAAPDACPNTPTGEAANAQGCSCSQVNCDDGDPCTVDSCAAGVCQHAGTACDDGNACTADTCPGGVCNHAPINCDDNNPCTVDSCNSATGCVHTPITCDDGDACTTDACNNGVCQHSPISCDDGNACTTDACNNGVCSHTPITCDDGDACTTDACNNGVCSHTPISCDDGNPCTADVCAAGACVHLPITSGDCAGRPSGSTTITANLPCGTCGGGASVAVGATALLVIAGRRGRRRRRRRPGPP